MEALITHCHTIFDEQLSTATQVSSPPLPPAPLGETPALYPYGSAHTKFSEYESQHQFGAPLQQNPTLQTTGDDFTPRLPPQPPASIHPSSRGNTGSSNGHSNISPTLTEVEPNVSSPTSYVPSPPLPLRPGRQGAQASVQSLRGTEGLDFSQRETSEGGWDGSPPASPPLSGPPSPLPATFKSPPTPTPPTPSTLLHPTPARQQQQPALTQTPSQEQLQPKVQSPSPAIERTTVGGPQPIDPPFEPPSSSMADGDHPTDYSRHLTPGSPGGPTLQPATPLSLTQQIPVQVTEAPDQFQRSPIHPLRQSVEVQQGRREPQDETPPSQLQ